MDQRLLLARWLKDPGNTQMLPWQVDIDTSNICNQDCYYCNSKEFRDRESKQLPLDPYINLVDKLSRWRVDYPNTIGTINGIIYSGGGEPTLIPGFERLLEKTIDCGFLTALNTNGTKLEKLLEISPEKLKKMAYIGLDLDSADSITYENIRRSFDKKNVFDKVKISAAKLGSLNVPIDIKILLMDQNTTDKELNLLFQYAVDVNARSLHCRPVVLNNDIFKITQELQDKINNLSIKYGVKTVTSISRYEKRQYTKCHQLFLFPSFSADGNIYLCCEYKGRQDLKLGSWIDSDNDWRKSWGSQKHQDIYNKFLTHFCKPCRPNKMNNQIQQYINMGDEELKNNCFF